MNFLFSMLKIAKIIFFISKHYFNFQFYPQNLFTVNFIPKIYIFVDFIIFLSSFNKLMSTLP